MTDDNKSCTSLGIIEKIENDHGIEIAKKIGKAYTFIALDGCEITAYPDGKVFYNRDDWF